MTSHEMAEWEAYYSIEGFGPPALAMAGGVVAATLANVNRGKDVEPFWPEDFMPAVKDARDVAEHKRKAMKKWRLRERVLGALARIKS